MSAGMSLADAAVQKKMFGLGTTALSFKRRNGWYNEDS